jgi:hypothetical protein
MKQVLEFLEKFGTCYLAMVEDDSIRSACRNDRKRD